MKLAVALLITLTALSQDVAEFRGSISEYGSNVPLPGVEITLYEMIANEAKLIGTTFSDPRGTYSIKLTRVGLYRFEAKKAGYLPRQNAAGELSRTQLRLTAERPRMDLNLTFMRPAALTGRVIDEERQPIADLPVFVQLASSATSLSTGRMATTDEDGVFTARGLAPGAYVVRIARQSVDALIVTDDSEADFQVVDRDIESSFWPGGLEDPRAVVPIQALSGGLVSVGTIPVRTVPYYAARVEYDGDCAEGEEWHYVLMQSERADAHRTEIAGCRKKFLVRDIAPGSYTLAVWTGKENTRWSLTPLVVTSENIEATMRFSPSATVTVRVITPAGVAKPSLADLRVRLPVEGAPSTATVPVFQPDAEGQFAASNVPWPQHSVSLQGMPPTHYVKEIRLAGQSVVGNIVTLYPGAQLDIVLDDHPATITGKIQNYRGNEGPIPALTNMLFLDRESTRGAELTFALIGPDGSFRFTGLAPGEYRIKPNSRGTEQGQLVKVGVGETKTVEVKLP